MSSKMIALFDEGTIFNFKFLLKLLKRYKWITLLMPILVMVFAAYLYKGQNEIHSGAISFRYLPESKTSPATAMSALLPEQEKSLDSTEILGIVNSTNFLQTLAEDTYRDPDLNQMNFNSLFSKNKATFKEFVNECKDEACEIEFLRKTLPDFFEITEDDLVLNKYNVTVKTLSRFTTDKLIKYVAKNVNRYRLDTIIFQLEQQIGITETLVKKQEKQIKDFKIAEAVEGKKILQLEFEVLIQKGSIYGEMLSEKKVALEQGKISLKYTKSTIDRKVSNQEQKSWREYENLSLRKELLLVDINALEYSLGQKTNQDNVVIAELKQELKKITKEIGRLEKSKSFAGVEKFQANKAKSKNLTEFNVKVLKDQITSLEKNSLEIKTQKDILIAKINAKDEFISKNGASLDYLKLLQEKLLQIKLIKETVVSDLIFDEYLASTKRYKKYSLAAVVPFSAILAALFTLFLIILRYWFDRRLMDEEEFKVIFKDISFIGEIPKLD